MDATALAAIFDKLGRDHLQQIMARDSHPKGSAEWHRFDQGRWAFKEAALSVDRATGHTRDIYESWVGEWSPEPTEEDWAATFQPGERGRDVEGSV